jgi:hypothetical protein
LPHTRFGVAFSELKARLIDVVRRAGVDGIDADDLMGIVFGDRKRSRKTLKAHIWQINDALTETDFRIRSKLRHYVLVHGAKNEP